MSHTEAQPAERLASMDRRTVRRRADAMITQYTEVHDRSRVNFVTPPVGEPIILGEEELFLLLALDGHSSFAQIEQAFAAFFHKQLSPKEFERYLYQLYDFGVLETVDAPGATKIVGSAAARPGYLDYVPPEKLIQRVPWAIGICDPSPLLRLMAWVGRPMKYGVWLFIPAVYLAGLIFYRYQDQLFADLQTMEVYVSLYVAVICAFFLDNLVARLIQGAIATAYGAEIRLLGVSAFLGFLPRFFIEDMPIKRLSRRGMLWCYASPLLFRFFLFAGGIFIWFGYRGTSSISWAGLLCANLGFYSGLLSFWPILPGDAYRWLSVYVNDPQLRSKSLRLVFNLVRGLPLPRTLSRADRWKFFLFATLTFLGTGGLALGGYVFCAYRMIEAYQGVGMMLWTIIFTSSLMWLLLCFKMKDLLMGLTGPNPEQSVRRQFEAVDGPGANPVL
jgi:hypothetical protein